MAAPLDFAAMRRTKDGDADTIRERDGHEPPDHVEPGPLAVAIAADADHAGAGRQPCRGAWRAGRGADDPGAYDAADAGDLGDRPDLWRAPRRPHAAGLSGTGCRRPAGLFRRWRGAGASVRANRRLSDRLRGDGVADRPASGARVRPHPWRAVPRGAGAGPAAVRAG